MTADLQNTLTPIWQPTSDQIAQSNIQQWCDQLGLADYLELHRWSIEKRPEFWQAAVELLQIEFESSESPFVQKEDDPPNTVWFPNSRLNIVDSCFLADKDAVAIVSQTPGQSIERTTFAELHELTNRVANSLVANGYQPGDRIAVVLPMTRLSVPIYLGIISAGCSVVSIADSFAAPEIATRLNIADAKAVFTYDFLIRAGKSLPLYNRVAEATDGPIVTLPADESLNVSLRDQDLDWDRFLSDDVEFEPVIGHSNNCINVLFSSGTTGDPKAIAWNHLTPIRCAIDGHIHHNLKPGDVAVWPTNLGWMMGPWLIFASLINKASIGLYEDAPMGAEFGRFIQDAKVNMLGVVPTIVKSWRNNGAMEPFDWSSIKVFSSTGETSQPDDMKYLSELAGTKPIIEYCGGTEIGGGYITSTVVQPNVPSAFTTPSIGLDFLLLDENAQPADEGEVFLVPPSIGLSNILLNRDHFETYYGGVEKGPNGECLRRHGDHFKKIGDFFVAGGRTDDTMNLGGIKISSAELERVLNQTEGVQETAAIAVADRQGPDRLVVFAVLQKDLNPDVLAKEMNQLLKVELNPLFKVSQVEIIEALPRTASNKVMRRKLRERIAE